MMHTAIRLIRDEHRSMAAVLRAAEHVVSQALKSQATPDFSLLHAIMFYLREFPERRHHPHEDRVLFALLKSRTHEADAIIADLEGEHGHGDVLLHNLETAMHNWESGSPGAGPRFADVLSRYTLFYWEHMEKEESKIMPLAQRVLTHEDWHDVYAAFESHNDPMFGEDTADDFRMLFSRILRLATERADTDDTAA